jgi:hypothetical protein
MAETMVLLKAVATEVLLTIHWWQHWIKTKTVPCQPTKSMARKKRWWRSIKTVTASWPEKKFIRNPHDLLVTAWHTEIVNGANADPEIAVRAGSAKAKKTGVVPVKVDLRVALTARLKTVNGMATVIEDVLTDHRWVLRILNVSLMKQWPLTVTATRNSTAMSWCSSLKRWAVAEVVVLDHLVQKVPMTMVLDTDAIVPVTDQKVMIILLARMMMPKTATKIKMTRALNPAGMIWKRNGASRRCWAVFSRNNYRWL